ncbi:MAG: YicC family protein [Flavobacteriales bacterium CG03_land_8_20_14_0_80_35_15]|nr:MAG: YicC family protein [Flavobacteriales bacterium CG03_land_8_20_14_0_80_35_15]PIX05886.1 MAG: YicC family protein [Flavobacteriales bacterium CG_4_8_14_3_um_filter_35_10]
MIQSMTGYGKTEILLPTKKISIELKSLNSKNLDLNLRVPTLYKEKELEIRKIIGQAVQRGKLDCSIYIEQASQASLNCINKEVVNHYINQLQEFVKGDAIEYLKIAIKLPDALKVEHEDLDENEWLLIAKGIDETIQKFNNYRLAEGASLAKDIIQNITSIKSLLAEVLLVDKDRISNKKEKLRKAIDDLIQNVDQNRFEQELIYYIEKLDINEEEVRLENHLNYFLKVINEVESNGRKLGFITQEMGREINTIGSKANDSVLQKIVVNMKDELEKIKEQLLNIL